MKMRGARVIIEVLLEQGTEVVFGYPGGAVLPIYDELYLQAERIRHIVTCHEQGAAHAADGYARATGRVGVVLATSGPGATNLVTGVATAYLDSTPLVAITGNVESRLIGSDGFQEVNILGVTLPVTKHNFVVRDVAELAPTLREAFCIAKSGRPGPVLVDIPKDIQNEIVDYLPEPAVEKEPTPRIDEGQLAKAVELIGRAERPFVYSGGGVGIAGAAAELLALAERIGAPVGSSLMGLSAIDHDEGAFLGMTGMHGSVAALEAMRRADLIVAVGTRFSDRSTGDKEAYVKNKSILHIDIDPAEVNKNIHATSFLIGDVKEALTALLGRVPANPREAWRAEADKIKKSIERNIGMDPSRLNPQMILEAISEKTGGIRPIATDVGQHQMWVTQYCSFHAPRNLITSGGLGTMGFGLGAAIGASVGRGEAKAGAEVKGGRTVLVTSDGSFHMNLNELATAVSLGLPLVIVVLDNRSLGMVRQWQAMFYDKRYSHTSLERRTDFVALAKAFGAEAVRLENKEALHDAIEFAFSQSGPVLIDAKIDPDEMALPMIPAGKSVENIVFREESY